MREKGLIHLYTGDGKGKTTAAVGLACRAAGCGKKVLVLQFLKGQKTGELASLSMLGIRVVRSETKKFIPYMDEQELEQCRVDQVECLKAARADMDNYDLVVLDEVIGAVTSGTLTLSSIIDLVKNKPEHTELVLTGRDAPKELVELADYVSEISCIKHPYTQGIVAREGIEY